MTLTDGGNSLSKLSIKENVPMITDVQRIVVKRNNPEIKTNTLILTFNTPKIPDSLKICYLNIPVSQYVPNPIRCCKCQRFGHVTSKCKHSEVCARCSETGHKDITCATAFKCVNCEENHTSSGYAFSGRPLDCGVLKFWWVIGMHFNGRLPGDWK